MGDAQHGAGPLHDRVFQRAQQINVRVVRRLVQHQQVAILFQHLRTMHSYESPVLTPSACQPANLPEQSTMHLCLVMLTGTRQEEEPHLG